MKKNWKKTEIHSDFSKSNNLIDSYGSGGFTISGTRVNGSVFLFPGGWRHWDIRLPEDVSYQNISKIDKFNLNFDVFLIGTGNTYIELDPDENGNFVKNGIQPDIMTTGAACRTWNILILEGRKSFAAILAV